MATLGMTEADREAIEQFRRDVIEPSRTNLVIVDFWAEWCGPCKQLGPVLDKVASDYADKGVVLAKIDVDQNRLIADQFRVQSIPTVYALFQGQPVADLTQYRTEAQLTRVLDQLLGQLPVQGQAQALAAEIEPMLATAEDLLDSGDWQKAESMFTQIRNLEPANPAATGGLARALFANGKPEEARELIAALDGEALKHPSVARARAALDVAVAPASDTQELEARLHANPDDQQARYDLAQASMANGERDRAADLLLDIITQDRDWNEGAARAKFLTLLEASGLEDPWARGQRRRLSALLFT